MTVKDLREKLAAFDQDMEVICVRYSDYRLLEETDPYVVQAYRAGKPGDDQEWITRNHPRLADEDRVKVKNWLCFSGN